jgi:hypothetical protein
MPSNPPPAPAPAPFDSPLNSETKEGDEDARGSSVDQSLAPTPSSVTSMGMFLSNTTNSSKKNDKLLHEIKNHRLYNIKKGKLFYQN